VVIILVLGSALGVRLETFLGLSLCANDGNVDGVLVDGNNALGSSVLGSGIGSWGRLNRFPLGPLLGSIYGVVVGIIDVGVVDGIIRSVVFELVGKQNLSKTPRATKSKTPKIGIRTRCSLMMLFIICPSIDPIVILFSCYIEL